MRLTDKRYPASDPTPAPAGPKDTLAPGRRTRAEARYPGLQAKKAPLQRKGDGRPPAGEGPALPGSGGSLPAPVQEKMEGAFAADFSDVRVHANSEAPAQVGAVAYAQGREIAFAPGQYDPSSQTGHELIGHELTHVVQQSGGQADVQAKGDGINADASLEHEADDLGARAARGESVAVKGVGSGVQRKGGKGEVGASSSQAVALAVVRSLMDGLVGRAARRAARKASKASVDKALRPQVLAQARAAADAAAQALILAATDARTGTVRTTKHGTGEFERGTGELGREATEQMQEGHGYSEASSKEVGDVAQRAGQQGGKEAATVMANRLAGETAKATAEVQLGAVEEQIADEIRGLADERVGAVKGAVEAHLARRAEKVIVPSPELAPAGPDDLSATVRVALENSLVKKAVEEALADQRLFKAATKAAKKLEKSTGSATKQAVSETMSAQEGEVRRTAIGEAGVAARNAVADIESEADDEDTSPMIATISGEIEQALNAYVAGKLKATRFHQFGRRRELREQLKSTAREVVNDEISQQMPQGQEREGQEDQLTYHETLAKREAYGEVKQDVNEFLTQIAAGIAGRAARDQKMAMAICVVAAKKAHSSVEPALRAAKPTLIAHAKTQALVWVEQLYTDLSSGNVTPVEAAQQASQTQADVGQLVRGRGVAAQVIEAADSEEGVGIMGKLFDHIVPDSGDGVTAKITLKIPLMTDPFGGFAAKLNLLCEINGKAGRGTEGFVTAGVPAIASNPNHLELELGYAIGLQLEAGDSSTLGVDTSVSYQSFVRAGADSTQSAMAAFRYAVYRGTPIKQLAGFWYGGMVQKRGGQPQVDYMLAEQRAAAVEEQHFLGEGKERTFAQHGRGIGAGVSAAANVDGATLGKLGAKGEISGGASRFRVFNAETLGDRPDTPTDQESAKRRRKAMAKGAGSKGKNGFSFAVASEVNLGPIALALSGALSGNDLENWGIELKAGLGGSLANGGSMDAIITLATALYELEHKLLSAMGSHMDQKDEMLAKGMSEEQIRNKLHRTLQKRNLAQGVANVGMVGLSAAGLAESSLAVSFQFGLSGGSWTDRIDLISSTTLATPDSLPVFGAELVKETRLITAEHQGKKRRAFHSPGVLAENRETD